MEHLPIGLLILMTGDHPSIGALVFGFGHPASRVFRLRSATAWVVVLFSNGLAPDFSFIPGDTSFVSRTEICLPRLQMNLCCLKFPILSEL